MNKFLIKLPLLGLLAVMCGILAGCEETSSSSGPKFSVSVHNIGCDYVDLKVVKDGCTESVYVLKDAAQDNLNNPQVIFLGGKAFETDSDGIMRIEGLNAEKEYYLYAAAKISDAEFYKDIAVLEFKTLPYEFDELVTIVDRYTDGYKVHFTIPQETKERGNAIRFNQSCLMMYNYSQDIMKGDDYSATLYNGGRFVATNDTTIVFNTETCYFVDEEGYNDVYFDPISPGQPIVLVAAEYAWMTPETESDTFDFPAGWENGYYLPLLDGSYYGTGKTQQNVGILDIDLSSEMDAYWTGAFQRKVFRAKEPSLLDGTVKVEVSDIGPVNAVVTFTPDDNVYQYAYSILDSESYNQMLALCDNNEDYLQWAITSYFGAYTFGCKAAKGPIQITLKDLFYQVDEQARYRILVTPIGDALATSQSFYQTEFYTTAKVLDAPEVVVTPLEDKSTPYSACFNVKAPNKDLAYAYYAANYRRDWVLAVNSGKTYLGLVAGNYGFTEDELAEINSDEGLDMAFPTVDGETTRLVVVGYNIEDTPNNLNYEDITECPAVADVTTPYADPVDYVSSTLYEDLVGDWTATATILVGEKKIEHESKVSIMTKLDCYPETLPDEVYDLYAEAGWTKEETDGYYEELKYLSTVFEENRLEYQNRLLCLGWIDYDDYDRLDTMTPYDLFVSEDYSSVDVSSIFFDFGPKWYLDIAEGDVVTVPMDTYFLPPVSNWSIPYYLAAYSSETNYAITDGNDEQEAKFDVTISDDKNTITINPIVLKDDDAEEVKYYPNLIGNDNTYGTVLGAAVVSPVVLTRGWEEKAETSSAMTRSAAPLRGVDAELPETVYKPLTRLPKTVKYKQVEGSVMTYDKLQENFKKLEEILRNQNK